MPTEIKGYLFAISYGIICLALAVVLHLFGVNKK